MKTKRYLNLDTDRLIREACQKALPEKITDEEMRRKAEEVLEHELDILKKNGGCDLMYIVSHMVNDATENKCPIFHLFDIASSLVSYLLGISSINPLEYGLDNRIFFGFHGDKGIKIEMITDSISGINIMAESVKGLTDEERLIIRPVKDDPDFTEVIIFTVDCDLSEVETLKWELDNAEDDADFRHILNDHYSESGKNFLTITLDLHKPRLDMKEIERLRKELKVTTTEELISLISIKTGIGFREDALREWTENGPENVISYREALYNKLVSYGIDDETAFDIMDFVRMGLAHFASNREGGLERWDTYKDIMKEHGVPEDIIRFCEKVKYMVSRTRAVSWYQVLLTNCKHCTTI